MKDNIQGERRRPRATSLSLLAGLLFDEAGNLFTPTHATKKGRRYRYYVLRSLIKGRTNDPAGPVRLPAKEIEEFVLSQLSSVLQSAPGILDLFQPDSPGMTETQHVATVAKEYLASQEKVRSDVRLMITRVNVRQQKVELQLNRCALLKCVLEEWHPQLSSLQDVGGPRYVGCALPPINGNGRSRERESS